MEEAGDCSYILSGSPGGGPIEGSSGGLPGSESVVTQGERETFTEQEPAPNSLTSDETENQMQVPSNTGILPDGQHYIILTGAEQLNGEAENSDPDMSGNKRIKLEGDNNETYFITLTTEGFRPQQNPIKIHDNQTINPHLAEDVSQAWFTTKDDKAAIKKQGVTWKKGSWTKDEVELLQNQITEYCQKHDIADATDIIFKTSKESRKDFYRTISKGLQRPLFSVYRRVIRMYDQKNYMGKYSGIEMDKLRELRRKHGADWAMIGAELGRSASSVKDKCRLMNDRCNSGKWLPEEERRLTNAVYDLTGCKAGDSITHGLSWSHVAEKVESRSEKQCRTKWLNFLNWKVKGGTDWTREDDDNLVMKISQLNANDESDINWQELANDWSSVRSPQWLRGKWWSIKRHVHDYQMLPFRDVVQCLSSMHTAIRLKTTPSMVGRMQVAQVDLPRLNITPDMTIRLPSELCLGGSNSGSLLTTEEKTMDTLQAYQVLQQLTPTSTGTFLIAQPSKEGLSLGDSGLSTDQVIVHTLPVTSQNNNNNNSEGMTVGVHISNQVVLDPGDHASLTNALQLSSTLSQPDIQQSSLEERELELSHQGEIIHVALPEHQGDLEEIGHQEVVTSGLVLVSSASPQYVQSTRTQEQLLSNLTDPMLTSQSSDLLSCTSDAEGEKSHSGESQIIPIEN